MPTEHATEQVPHPAHLVELSQRYLLCLCRILSMARFASEAELRTFLGRLDPDYSQFASELWHKGFRTARQLTNASKSIFLSCGLPELWIDDIKATADKIGELNVLNNCTVCLKVHRCCIRAALELHLEATLRLH